MRHRIAGASHTGFGNSAPEFMDGKPTGDKERDSLIRRCSKECYETFFKGSKERGIDMDGVDAADRGDSVRIGIEPGYMYWPLKIIEIHHNKKESKLITGYSWEAWGSGLRLKKRWYVDYKYSSKFKRFVDKWHPKLYPSG